MTSPEPGSTRVGAAHPRPDRRNAPPRIGIDPGPDAPSPREGPPARTTAPIAPARGRRWLRALLVAIDGLVVVAAWGFALSVPATSLLGPALASTSLVAVLGVLLPAALVLMASQRLYLARVSAVRTEEVQRLGRVAVLTGLVLVPVAQVADVGLPLRRVLFGAALAFALAAMARSAFNGWLRAGRAGGRFRRPILVVGTNAEALDLLGLLEDHPELGFDVRGALGGPADTDTWPSGIPILGTVSDAVDAVARAGANGVLVASSALGPGEINRLSRDLVAAGAHVHLSTGLHGIDHRRLRPLPLAREPIFYLESANLAGWQLAFKRVMDVVVAGFLLLVTAPMLAVSAVAIKVQDRGPILFRQQRIGRYGVPFTVFKLRTMVPDAEHQLVELPEEFNERRGGPLFKHRADPRRTRVGRILEVCSVDEVPQLWNVLRGEMSLVGPRPALSREVAAFDDELLTRQNVPPGLTGLWQVEARDNPSFRAYRRYDLFYVENWSVSLDLAILLGTVRVVLARPFRRLFGREGSDAASGPPTQGAAPETTSRLESPSEAR